jgi:hypothetical protein
MVFPERPTGNAWQLIGNSFNQGAGIVNDLGTQQNALQALVERRTQAALEQKRLEREQAAKDWELQQKKDEADKQQKFLDAAAKMKEKGIPLPNITSQIPGGDMVSPSSDVALQEPTSIGGKAVKQYGYQPQIAQRPSQTITTQGGFRPANAQDYADTALQYGQITPKDYLEPSAYDKAKATMEGSIAGGALDKIAAGQRDRISIQDIGGRKVKVNLDTNEQTDLGSSEKPMTPYQRASLERLNNMPVGSALNTRSLMTDSRAARMDYEKAAKPYLALKGIIHSPAYGTGLGDQSMIDKLIMIETGRTPTEAQYFQMAHNLGIDDKIDKVTGKLLNGSILGPTTRKNMMAQAEEQMKITHDSYINDLNQFQEMANENGVNVNAVSRRGGYYQTVDKYLGGQGENPLTDDTPTRKNSQKQTPESSTPPTTDPRKKLATLALKDPKATEAEKAQARKILGL